jgi:chromate transporter
MLLKLFLTFFKIGAFTIGGGYAMLPVIQKEVVDKKNWLTTEEFLDSIAVTNSLPGPLATNCATFVGYTTAGVPGALASVLGAITPSFLIIMFIAALFTSFADNHIVQLAFSGIRPAVVALILFSLIKLVKSVGIKWINTIISISALGLILIFNLHPAFVIIIFGTVGFFFMKNEEGSK